MKLKAEPARGDCCGDSAQRLQNALIEKKIADQWVAELKWLIHTEREANNIYSMELHRKYEDNCATIRRIDERCQNLVREIGWMLEWIEIPIRNARNPTE
ncbi:hypothetical protein OSTOST_01078 [Ostertagia ostertagi]